MECLLVIDMQNEFTTDGKFSKNCIGNEILLQNICNLIAKFRENHKPIFFCKSIYTPKQRKHKQHKHKQQKFNSSENYSSFLKGTHLGKNICCEPNSENSEIHPIIRKKVLHNEEIIIKNFYSAFKNTDLEKLLSAQNIKTCFLSGVKTNVCLAATAQDAIELGLNVVLVQDCSAATTLELNQKGLQHMVELGASICQTKDIQFQLVKQFSHTFGEGDCFVYYNVLPKSISDVCFEALKKEVNWHQMYHGSRVVSRLVCVQGDIDSNGSKPLYRFPTDHFFQLEKWTPMAKKIRNILQEKLNACQCFGEKNALNHAKIQYYKDGNSYITAHSDKTCDIKRNSFIVNISFGATRTFVLRHKKKKEQNGAYIRQRILLPHNAMVIFGFKTNAKWKHSVEKEPELKQDRISIVYRDIATFEKDGKLFGQGAPFKSLEMEDSLKMEDSPEILKKQEQQRLMDAFCKENKESDFDWDKVYGKGFDVLDFSLLR